MAYIYDLTDTWNAGGTTFNGIKLNVTDSASAVASKLVSLQTNGTEHFSVTKAGVGYFSGNVGIGSSSPAHKLEVSGNTRVPLTNSYYVYTQDYGMGTPDSSGLQIFTGLGDTIRFGRRYDGTFTELLRIDASGNLLVGTTAKIYSYDGVIQNYASQYNILVAGPASGTTCNAMRMVNNDTGSIVGSITYTSTGTAYNTSSDYRLKNIDGPIANSGAYIDALKPVQGSWKADGSRFIGLLAHEVQEVSETPIATGTKDGAEMQAMDYSAPELIANLIAEIQSLRARVAQLEGN